MSEEKSTNSIIDPKYAQALKNKPKDWLGQFLDERVTEAQTREKVVKTKDDEGNVTETTETVTLKARKLDLDSLFGLCKANNIDTEAMEAQRDRKNAPGRIRMTLGNQLRAAAKHRHGLYDADGEWHEADADFLGEAERTHERDGTKIVVAKPESDDAEAA